MTGIAGQLLRDDVRLMRELCVIDFRFWRGLRWLNAPLLRSRLRCSQGCQTAIRDDN